MSELILPSADDVNRRTVEHFSSTWLLQTLANIPHIAAHPSISALTALRRQRFPAFIIGAGPSLEKNAGQLQALRGKGLVIAACHALQRLAKLGVAADIACVLDPQIQADNFDGIVDLGAVAVSASTHSSAFKLPWPVFTFSAGFGIDDWVYDAFDPLEREQAALPPGGGTVTCAAYSIARLLHCYPIVLVGQDLAFDGDRYYGGDHPVRVTLSEDKSQFLASWPGGRRQEFGPAAQAPAWNGDGTTVMSSLVMTYMAKWFANRADPSEPGAAALKLINATEGGLRIDGWAHEPLSDVLWRLKDRDEVEVWSALARLHEVPESRHTIMAGFLKNLAWRCRKSAAQAEYCFQLLRQESARLPEEEAKLRELCNPIMPIIQGIRRREYWALRDKLAASTKEERPRYGLILYRTIAATCRLVRPELEKAATELDSARKTADPTP